MNRFVAIVVPDEKKANESVEALQNLHHEGSVTVYATAVVHREANGALAIKQADDAGPVGAALNALLGLLVGAFGAPRGIATGAASGGAVDRAGHPIHMSVTEEFAEDLAEKMRPGDFAVVSEVLEEWTAPVDTRIALLGGSIVRESRRRDVEELFRKAADEEKAELELFKTRRATSKAPRMESDLEYEIDSTARRLRRRADKAKRRIDRTKEELDAKLKALEEQAAKAKPDIRSRIEQRIPELRRDFNERAEKLQRAYEITQEALRA